MRETPVRADASRDPGSFVYGSTVETIKQGISRVRNRAIVRILRELHLMEILGSGYERACSNTSAVREGQGFRSSR